MYLYDALMHSVLIENLSLQQTGDTCRWKRVCYSQIPIEGDKPGVGGLLGEAPGWSGGRKRRGSCKQEFLLWFLQQRTARQDKQA